MKLHPIRSKFRRTGIAILVGIFFVSAASLPPPPRGAEVVYPEKPIPINLQVDAANAEQGKPLWYFRSQCDSATGGGCMAMDPVTKATFVVRSDEVSKTPVSFPEPPPAPPGKVGEKDNCIDIPVANAPANDSVPSPINPPVTATPDRSPASSDKPTGSKETGTATSPVTTFAYSSIAAENARGLDLLAAAQARNDVVLQAARNDESHLASKYVNMPPKLLQESFERAQGFLGNVAEDLSDGKSKMDPSESARFRNLYLNARDKAALAAASLEEPGGSPSALGKTSPFEGLLTPGPGQNPLARTAELENIFGNGSIGKNPTSTDSLLNRLVMLGGLSDQDRRKTLKELSLVENVPFKSAGGKTVEVPILHNGYLLGGGKSAIDCSSFVSQILPADIRKGNLTTLDLRNIWIYKKRGRIPNPPVYQKERLDLIKTMSDGFVAIDLYHGDQLAVGDLLIYRLPWDPVGHVFLVKSYNPSTMRAEVIEAAQSAGTIREREFSLTRDAGAGPVKTVQPGLLALRLNPVSNRCCGYSDARKPASRRSRSAKEVQK